MERIALESRLRACKNVITLGVRTNLSDYEEWQLELIRNSDVIYYPTAFYADILDTVGKREGINVTELARAHGITKSAVSQAVKKLERKGLIERYRMPDNRKEVLFRITTEGRVAFEAHLDFHDQVEGPFSKELASLSEDEARGITKLMDLLDRRAALVRKLESDNEEEVNSSES